MLRNETNKGSDTYIQPMLARYSLEADDYKKKTIFRTPNTKPGGKSEVAGYSLNFPTSFQY